MIGEKIDLVWGGDSNKNLSTKLGTFHFSNKGGTKESNSQDTCNTCITCNGIGLGGSITTYVESPTREVTVVDTHISDGVESHTNEGSYPSAHDIKNAATTRVYRHKHTDAGLPTKVEFGLLVQSTVEPLVDHFTNNFGDFCLSEGNQEGEFTPDITFPDIPRAITVSTAKPDAKVSASKSLDIPVSPPTVYNAIDRVGSAHSSASCGGKKIENQ